MKERPIIFSGEMVRAILAGRKTQTRRVIKLPSAPLHLGVWEACTVGGKGCFQFVNGLKVAVPERPVIWHTRTGKAIACPYGQAGDSLWVRESLCGDGIPNNRRKEIMRYAADGEMVMVEGPLSLWQFNSPTVPPIHMPRWASRLSLEIVNVRVERLQDISAADIIAEGVTVDVVMDMLSPLNKEKPLPCHWFSSEYTDSSINWCLKCAKKHQAELRKANPNAEFPDALEIDGGWETDHESHPYCEGCGVRLEGYLTIEGKLAETEHFKSFRGEITSDVAHDLLACIEKLPPRVFWQIVWTVINGHENWNTNPLVWVIEFKRVENK